MKIGDLARYIVISSVAAVSIVTALVLFDHVDRANTNMRYIAAIFDEFEEDHFASLAILEPSDTIGNGKREFTPEEIDAFSKHIIGSYQALSSIKTIYVENELFSLLVSSYAVTAIGIREDMYEQTFSSSSSSVDHLESLYEYMKRYLRQ